LFNASAITRLLLVSLVIIGSLGLPVWVNLLDMAQLRLIRHGNTLPGRRRFSLQSKLVLTTTAAVYFAGVVTLGVSQMSPRATAFHPAHQPERVQDARPTPPSASKAWTGAAVLAATRTTGFAPPQDPPPTDASRFVLIPLMLIGGSPGSACGGVRTLSVAILALALGSTLRRNRPLEAFHRNLPEPLLRLAITWAGIAVGLSAVTALLLSWLHPEPISHTLFNAVSVVCNSGLAWNLPSELTAPAKGVMIAAMIAGRVTPLVLLAVSTTHAPRAEISYPEEPLTLG
jgi:trk system potassium uptake protein TrkH